MPVKKQSNIYILLILIIIIIGLLIAICVISYSQKKVKNLIHTKPLKEKSRPVVINNIYQEDKKTLKPRKCHRVSFQYVDLDKSEYKFIKPLYSKITNTKKDDLYKHIMELYKGYHFGLGETEKRKAYPINRYNTFYGFKEE